LPPTLEELHDTLNTNLEKFRSFLRHNGGSIPLSHFTSARNFANPGLQMALSKLFPPSKKFTDIFIQHPEWGIYIHTPVNPQNIIGRAFEQRFSIHPPQEIKQISLPSAKSEPLSKDFLQELNRFKAAIFASPGGRMNAYQQYLTPTNLSSPLRAALCGHPPPFKKNDNETFIRVLQEHPEWGIYVINCSSSSSSSTSSSSSSASCLLTDCYLTLQSPKSSKK
jgi:hypothetical protein